MTSYVTPKINTAFVFYVSLEDAANPGLFKASPTLANGDVLVATDNGAPGNIATLPTVDADFTKRLVVSLSAGEMNGDNVTVIFSDAAGAEWYDLIVNLQTSARQIDDLAFPTTSGRGLDVSATGEAGLDFDNVKAATAPTTLTNVTVPTVTTLTNMPAASNDWSATEREQLRYRLQIDGTQTAPTDTDLPAVNVTYSAGVALTGRLAQVTDLPAAAPTAAATADAVLDELLSGHVIAGSAGAALSAAGAAGDPWSVVLPGAYASDEAGGIIGGLAGIDTSAVTVTASNNAGVLTFVQSVTFAATISGLTISGTWAKLYFTLKESEYDDDSDAILQIVESNPGAGADGLLYLDSAAIVSPITVADGTLTVSQVAGTVAIAITDNATALLSKASGLVWDIKTKDAAGATVQNTTGTASITRAVTQTI